MRPAAHRRWLAPVVLTASVVGNDAAPSGAERSWVEVRSPHFVAVSDSGESDARSILWQLEQIRTVVEKLWPWARVQADRPVLVLAVRGEPAMKALAPEYWEKKGSVRPSSVFVGGPDRYYLALRTDVDVEDREGINPYANSYWSYVALMIASSTDQQLPLWYHRGLASVLSNTLVRKDGIQIGRVLPGHLQQLNRRGRLKLRELVAVDRDSPWYTQSDRHEMFEAQSWAFAHFLLFADKGAHRPKLNRYGELLSGGKPPAAALEESLGNPDDYELAFADYFGRQLFGYARIDNDVRIRREDFASRPLTSGEAAAAAAAFHVAMRRPNEARPLIDEARKSEASQAASYEVEGVLLDQANQNDPARAAFAKATELGSKNFYAYYRLAGLLWTPQADLNTLAAIEPLLDRACVLNPRSDSAFAALARARLRLDRPEAALTPAHRAVAINAGEPNHRLVLARVLWALSRRDEAVAHARAGLALARSDADRANAKELLDFFEKHTKQ